ncbi:hypothetical protein D3C86_1903600 [compost metagenome]
MQKLGTMANNPGFLYSAADHVAADVLKEQQWNIEGVAGPDKSGCLVSTVVEQHAAFIL